METDHKIIIAEADMEFEAGRVLFKEYASGLDFDLCFQDFGKELEEITIQYNKPLGALLLIKNNEEFIGCAGIRLFEKNIAELKRMYIRKEYRSFGFGKELMNFAIDFSKRSGYEFIRLDTMKSMKAAINIYKEYGFYEITPYRFNPCKDALYMEKKL